MKHNRRQSKVPVLCVSRGDAVLRLRARVAKSVLKRSRVIPKICWWIEVKLEARAANH